MGFLNRLFKREKKDDLNVTSVHLNELKDWHKEASKEDILKIKQTIKELLEEIDQRKQEIKDNLNSLEQGELKNKNIPVKEMQIMQGNRNAYIKMTRQFISTINTDVELSYSEIKEFCDSFKENLKNLSESTKKSYAVLMHFFSNELNSISKLMNKLVNHASDIEDQIESNLKPVHEIKDKIDELYHEIKTQKQQKIQLKEDETNIVESQKALEKTEKEIHNLKNSSEFKNVQLLKKKKETIKDEIKQNEYAVIGKFSPLESALKKYQRVAMEDTDLIEKYAADPSKALENDSSPKIFDILQKLANAINSGQIDLKDKKKEKALEAINNIDKEYITSLKTRKEQLKQTLLETERSLKNSRIGQEIEEYEYKKEHLTDKIKKLKEKTESVRKKLEGNYIKQLAKKLSEASEDILNTKLEIKLETNDETDK